MSDERTVTLLAQESHNIDTVVYRGTAKLHELTTISQVDVYDQVTNPNGIQRDVSVRHAAEAYDYVTREPDKKLPRAFPEVMLNVRDLEVIDVEEVTTVEGTTFVKITVDLDALAKARSVKISRVDGNHRLFFGGGDRKDRQPVDVTVPFSILLGLTREQEAELFSDVNANQKGMNTSHLAVLRSRLTREEVMLIREPWAVYAKRLAEDKASPFGKAQLIYMGGSKQGSKDKGLKYPLTLKGLETAVKRMFRTSEALKEMSDDEARYKVVRNYWQAVQSTWPEAFKKPEDYMLAKSIGVNSLAQLAGKVIDRCYNAGELDMKDMQAMLEGTKDRVNWDREVDHHDGGVRGLNGNSAVLAISELLSKGLPKLKRGGQTPDIAKAIAEQKAADDKRAKELLAQDEPTPA